MAIVVLNSVLIIVCGAIGLFAKNLISKEKQDFMFLGLGLCVIYLGLNMAFQAEDPSFVIISIVLGGLIGSTLKIHERLYKIESKLEEELDEEQGQDGSTMSVFISTTFLYCVGSMAILGPLQAGLTGNTDTLMAKSILDGVSSIIFASTMGIGVLFAAAPVFIVQGLIFLGAQFLEPFISQIFLNDFTGVGGIIIFAIGLNFLNLTKIKVTNFLPGLFVVAILHIAKSYLSFFF